MPGPATTRTVVIEVSHPGYRTMSAELALPVGDTPTDLDQLAIDAHLLLNDLIMAIRKEGPR